LQAFGKDFGQKNTAEKDTLLLLGLLRLNHDQRKYVCKAYAKSNKSPEAKKIWENVQKTTKEYKDIQKSLKLGDITEPGNKNLTPLIKSFELGVFCTHLNEKPNIKATFFPNMIPIGIERKTPDAKY